MSVFSKDKSSNTAAFIAAVGLLSGAVGAALATYVINRRQLQNQNPQSRRDRFLQQASERREQLPPLIILVRHGESEGNADHTLYRTKPDNLVNLTDCGIQQARRAGKRIEEIFQLQGNIHRVHLIVSPFERTLQTAATLRSEFEHRIVRTNIEPRIREQEFGNLQCEKFKEYREEQRRIGRFWYRFATGESGADVYDRVKSWWFESVLTVNERAGHEPVDALVVVTHGLTMRFVLMQLFSWSPTTFHSVWNAGNCDIYLLKKDLHKSGLSPYVLDGEYGDMPKSSINLMIEFKKSGEKKAFKLHDYLSIPPPRTTKLHLVKAKLAEQYPSMDVDDIQSIIFMPFVDGAVVQGRTTSGVLSREHKKLDDLLPGVDDYSDADSDCSEVDLRSGLIRARQEVSCRIPTFDYWRQQQGPKSSSGA